MHVVVVFLEAKGEHQDDMRDALLVYAETCLDREPGCRRFDIGNDLLEPSSFLLYEVFADAAAHAAHREMPHYAEFRALADPWTETRRVLTYDLISIDRPSTSEATENS